MFKSYCYMMLKMFVAKRSVMPITKVIFVQRNIYQEILTLSSVPLVSVLKRFDCNCHGKKRNDNTYPAQVLSLA